MEAQLVDSNPKKKKAFDLQVHMEYKSIKGVKQLSRSRPRAKKVKTSSV
jgi:hypothetical protein